MKGLVNFAFFAACFFCAPIFGQIPVPELPNFPASPLGASDISALCAKDSKDEWAKLASESKAKAAEFALKQSLPEAAQWLYTGLAEELFASDGAAIPPELKAIMLSNLPAFFDFYETLGKDDIRQNVCDVLSSLFKIYPIQTKKYLRAAYAVALMYDSHPSAGWPECFMPSNPTYINQPQEIFFFFVEDPKAFAFELDMLTVGELGWVVGIGGPVKELKDLRRQRIFPSTIEKIPATIKTDASRQDGKKWLSWDESFMPFTAENIKKNGAVGNEKIYYAFRVANANGIPCVYFAENSKGGESQVWLAYMAKPGSWKYDVFRTRDAKPLFGRAPNPLTWETLDMFDLSMVERRAAAQQAYVDSMTLLRLSEYLFENGKYADAALLADRAKKAWPENWRAYIAQISARARGGAEQAELDDLWKKGIEAFRRYPDALVRMVGLYRDNLAARRKAADGDKLFITEMRWVMRVEPGLGIDIYSREILDMFARMTDKAEILPLYQDILRMASSNPAGCFRKITVPLAAAFESAEDKRGAYKVISMYESAMGATSESQKLKEKYSSKKQSKEIE